MLPLRCALQAKYGKRGEDGRMTPEQYQALRRKVIGTARDYWKDWVEEEQGKPGAGERGRAITVGGAGE